MNVNRDILKKMIISEMKIISEGCGCGCGGSPGGCGEDSGDPPSEDHGENVEFMAKDESLKAVVAIAMSTSCPITRNALLSVVEDLL